MSPIEKLVFATLTKILQPLVEKWDKEINHGYHIDERLGLQRARTDVQSIIDTGLARLEIANREPVPLTAAPQGPQIKVMNETDNEVDIIRRDDGTIDIVVRPKE